MINCATGSSPAPELYSLTRRSWQTVHLAPSLQRFCQATDGMPFCTLTGVGADWIEVKESCYHCRDFHDFQNIQTGQLASATTPRDLGQRSGPGGTTIPDLDSPTLIRRLCRPLRVPTSWDNAYDQSVSGMLMFHGSFAVASGVRRGSDNQFAFIERCGSRLHVPIPDDATVIASSHAVIWQAGGVNGVLLPSLRRLRIILPGVVTRASGVVAALSQRTLYVLGRGQLWTASSAVFSR